MLGDTEKGKTVMKKTNEVSELVGVSKRTLQYYDDEGLISAEDQKIIIVCMMKKHWKLCGIFCFIKK